MRQLMQQELSLLACGKSSEHFAAKLSNALKPGTEISRKLRVNLLPQSLGERRAFAGSRDGDLQIATAYDRSEVEVAVRRIIDGVAQDIALDSCLIDRSVDGSIVCGGYHEERLIKIGGTELTPHQLNPPPVRKGYDFGPD